MNIAAQTKFTVQRRFGKRLTELRHRAGFSQEELAHGSGLNRSYVADIERGARNPSLFAVTLLLRALGYELCARRPGVERPYSLIE